METEDLERNPLFSALMNEYRRYFAWAQVKNGVVIVPTIASLRRVVIDRKFIDKHIFRPVNDGTKNPRQFEGRDSVSWFCKQVPKIHIPDEETVQTIDGYSELGYYKIIATHFGINYNEDMYRIYIIDRPLYAEMRDNEIHNDIIREKWFLMRHDPSDIDYSTLQFNNLNIFYERYPASYVVRDDMFLNVENFMSNLEVCDNNIEDLIPAIRYFHRKACIDYLLQLPERLRTPMKIPINQVYESNILSLTYEKVFNAILQLMKQKDQTICSKLEYLKPITLARLGCDPLFEDLNFKPAIEKLELLDSCKCILSKLNCIYQVVQLITNEVKTKSVRNKNKKFLDTLDYLPVLAYCIATTNKSNYYSNIYFISNFKFCTKPYKFLEFSYSIFMSALNYLMKLSGPILDEQKDDKGRSSLEFFGLHNIVNYKDYDIESTFTDEMSYTEKLIRASVYYKRSMMNQQAFEIQRIVSGMLERQTAMRAQELKVTQATNNAKN